MCGHCIPIIFFSSYVYALFFQASNHNKLTCRYIILVCMHYYINIATSKQLTCGWEFELWTRATKVWPETEIIWKLKEVDRYLFPPPKIMLLQKQQNLLNCYNQTNHIASDRKQLFFFFFFFVNSSFLQWEWVGISTSTFNIHVIY